MKKTITTKYPKLIFWSEEDEAFIATVPGLPNISAHGDTYEEAAAELSEAIDLCQEVAEEQGKALPLPMELNTLEQAASLLNLTELARRIGVTQSTLSSKIKRGTALKEEESRLIQKALRSAGLFLVPSTES